MAFEACIVLTRAILKLHSCRIENLSSAVSEAVTVAHGESNDVSTVLSMAFLCAKPPCILSVWPTSSDGPPIIIDPCCASEYCK